MKGFFAYISDHGFHNQLQRLDELNVSSRVAVMRGTVITKQNKTRERSFHRLFRNEALVEKYQTILNSIFRNKKYTRICEHTLKMANENREMNFVYGSFHQKHYVR